MSDISSPSLTTTPPNAATPTVVTSETTLPFYMTPSSVDYDTMMHEYQQFPSIEEFNTIINDYLQNLSSKKRDKALVDSHRYKLILQVLKDPRNTAISTAQFRFWVKKMFRLSTSEYMEFVCHDDKPVATREDIYNILIIAHKEAHHGGRDKTSALVRKRYSWIPKELIARFVRHCPFCISRRNGVQVKCDLAYTPPPLSSSALLNFLSSPTTPITTNTKKRKNNQSHSSQPHWTNRYSMAANIATSAAAAAVASSAPPTAEDFDFFYSHPPNEKEALSPKPTRFNSNSVSKTTLPPYSYLLFSTQNNNTTPSAAAAAVVAAAAMAAVNSNNQPSSPSVSSCASLEPTYGSKDETPDTPTFITSC